MTERTNDYFLEVLKDNNVIEEVNEDEVRVTPEFDTAYENEVDKVEKKERRDLEEVASRIVSHESSVDRFLGADKSTQIIGEYRTLDRFVQTVPREELVRFLVVFDEFRRKPPRKEKSPNSFYPIHGDRLHALLPLFVRAIVYVWLDDCDPCDSMVEKYNTLFPEPSQSAILLSVYGPNWKELLEEEFNVVGGPTTLFFKNGKVDTRLQGDQYMEVIETEIDVFNGTV